MKYFLFTLIAVCAPLVSAKSAYCEACTEILGLVENKTCAELPAVCAKLPAGIAVTICDFLFDDTSVCSDIVKWLENGATPTQACQDIGLCSGGSCSHGLCTAAVAALSNTKKYRCLSLPNSCGHNVTTTAEPAFMKVGAHEHSGKFCVDGECETKHIGCCLTGL